MIDVFRLQFWYAEMGMSYHVAASLAATTQTTPVAGNLAHHAVEMYLKAFLSLKTSERDRKRLGHDLTLLWEGFDAETGARHAALRPLVTKIQEFEEVRYPERVLEKGMMLVIEPRGALHVDQVSSDLRDRILVLSIDEVDTLARAILRECPINLDVLKGLLRGEGAQHWI